ncbi:MAG: hypothetical protein LKG27_05025 [Clostridiaceae bacterium]|jgi:uncharacterized membrane protein|nr:hypothetical protein [Clostridiaceae bacterium]
MDSNSEQIYMIEKIVSCLTYPTMGMVGFIWLLLGLFTKARLKPFVQFHICQSIFISIGFVLLSWVVSFLSNILSFIPLINTLVAQVTFYLNMPLLFGFSLIQVCIYGVLTYLGIAAFLGKYSYFPYVSEIIDANIGRK